MDPIYAHLIWLYIITNLLNNPNHTYLIWTYAIISLLNEPKPYMSDMGIYVITTLLNEPKPYIIVMVICHNHDEPKPYISNMDICHNQLTEQTQTKTCLIWQHAVTKGMYLLWLYAITSLLDETHTIHI